MVFKKFHNSLSHSFNLPFPFVLMIFFFALIICKFAKGRRMQRTEHNLFKHRVRVINHLAIRNQ